MFQILITSEQQIKTTVAKDLLANHQLYFKKYAGSSEQPFGKLSVTIDCARDRIVKAFAENSITADWIVSIENGIWLDRMCDVCVVVAFNCATKEYKVYQSFGIAINQTHMVDYIKDTLIYKKPEDVKTFGQWLSPNDSANWMLEHNGIDRSEQIEDALVQFAVDLETRIVPNFPKPNVVFKDISSVMENPRLIKGIVDRIVQWLLLNNLKVDYVAGLQSRGYLFGPLIAARLNVGFICIRKADKFPALPTDAICKSDYSTEYSSDQFVLLKDPKYTGKKVIVIDDLIATGGSFNGAAAVLKGVGAEVIADIAIYDVPNLRHVVTGDRQRFIVTYDSQPNMYEEKLSGIAKNISRYQYQVPDIWAPVDMDLGCALLSTTNSCTLGNWIANYLDIDHLDSIGEPFKNGETRVEILDSVRNKHVFIVCQAQTGRVNDEIIELLMLIDACNRAGVDKITVVLPYFPYSRSDKKDAPRVPIGAANIAGILQHKGISGIVSFDLHAGQIQGFTDRGFQNLYAKRVICDYIQNSYLFGKQHNRKIVLIAPDVGSIKRVEAYAKYLGLEYIVLHKQRDYTKPGTIVRSMIIGDNLERYTGYTGIIIDDIADTMGTMISATNELMSKIGLSDIIIAVTHGVFSDGAIKKINNCPHISCVITTNTLDQTDNQRFCPKLQCIDISNVLAYALFCIVRGYSISKLF